jgi:hypothetical protein
MHPWQHLSGFSLSGQSSDKSGGQVVKQSHLDLSSGHFSLGFSNIFSVLLRLFGTFWVFLWHIELGALLFFC